MAIELMYIPFLISGIFCLVITSVILVLFFKNYLKSKNTSTILFIGFIILFIGWIVGSCIYPPLEKGTSSIICAISLVSSYIGFFCVFLFLEFINYDKVNVITTTFFAIIVTLLLYSLIFEVMNDQLLVYVSNFGYYPEAQTGFLSIIFQSVLILSIGIHFFITLIRVARLATTPEEKLQARLLFIGLIIMIGGVLINPLLKLIIKL